MNSKALVTKVLRLMEEITETGPILPEYDGLRVFDHRDRLLDHLTGNTAKVPPVTLDLWPSLTCNARCPLCQYRVSGAREEVDRTGSVRVMSPALADAIFSGAAAIGVRSVILTGGGEPTLNANLVDIARLARTHGLRWSLNTNAFILDKPTTLALLSESPSYLKISVDAGTAESHRNIYNVAGMYQNVLDNAIAAACISAELGTRNVGISFSLGSTTTDEELDDIRRAILHVLEESDGALGFVVFRARLLHYRGWTPVAPQPAGERFPQIADAIEERVINPLNEAWGRTTRFDLKKGLFLLAARERLPSECLSNSWMTTITQDGEGYATGELAGAVPSGQRWGQILQPSDFARMWYGPVRYALHKRIETGQILLPIVHRTSPVDEFLRRMRQVLGSRVSASDATRIIDGVEHAKWYRSRNSAFV
jgi:pyruvate-formate lyase-activating enzyme